MDYDKHGVSPSLPPPPVAGGSLSPFPGGQPLPPPVAGTYLKASTCANELILQVAL